MSILDEYGLDFDGLYDITEADEMEWTEEESVNAARYMLEENQTYDVAVIETNSKMSLNKNYVMELYNEMLDDHIAHLKHTIAARKDTQRNIASWSEEQWELMFKISKGTGQQEYWNSCQKDIKELEWKLKLYTASAFKYNDVIQCKECAKEFITGKNYEQHHKILIPLYLWQLPNNVRCKRCELDIFADWYHKQ